MAKRKSRVKQLALPLPPDPKLVEAMRDAEEILKWSLGPNPPPWRIHRLAKTLYEVADDA